MSDALATPQQDPPFIRYGCLGCLMSQPAGHCICGNEIGDEYCLRDRKLNTRATEECLRKGCLSAMYVENRTLVCAHISKTCEGIDRLGNSLGTLIRTRAIAEVIDAEKANESLRIIRVLKSRRHPSGAIVTEEAVSS
ncbi:hypothetical protein [Methanoregula sp.]|uniref:hypothetical protein n=1 Tax=Methanoregula sp. TaxID=2052170 RepID=UPI000CC027BC|nr:hypothetical protein [Methanoregula sp.]PKG31581.1 MAG: hypothetical protein CW742_12655 [Methanoregula sp.]